MPLCALLTAISMAHLGLGGTLVANLNHMPETSMNPNIDSTLDGRGPISVSSRQIVVDSGGVRMSKPAELPAPVPSPGIGKWIWVAGNAPTLAARFRRTIELPARLKRVTAWISADVSYRLWVNGRLVSRGPADTGKDYDAPAPGPWYDDVRELTEYFHAGKNVVCAEVFSQPLVGSEGSTGTPGFKFDAEFSSGKAASIKIGTDESWRASAALDIENGDIPGKGGGLMIDVRKEPVGWRSGSFDDRSWAPAVFATVPVERMQTISSGLPTLMEAVFPVSAVERMDSGIVPLDALGSVRIEHDASFAVRYPRVMSAYLGLHVHGVAGAVLTIMPNEPDEPGFHRIAQITLRDGEQFIELPFLDSFSVVNIEAKNISQPIVIEDVRATFCSYPVTYRGAFECSDPKLNEIWDVCRWVTQICMQTHHLDSPHHQEPICDPGDYLIEALVNDQVFAESALIKQDLQKFARILRQRQNHNFHTSYALLWLQTLLDYYDHTGDDALVRELAPAVHSLLDTFEGYIGQNGLISEAPNYMFMDWVMIEGFTLHHPPAVIGQGYMTALYYRALRDDRRVAELEGLPDRIAHDDRLRSTIATAFNRELWNSSTGLYRDGKPFQTHVKPGDWLPADKEIETFSTQVNTLAVACGLTDPSVTGAKGRSGEVMDRLLARPDMNCQPYFMHFVFEALEASGRFEQYAVAQMLRWKILPDTRSFHEMWEVGDRSHAWIASPLYQMSARILGVQPIGPGYRRIRLAPQPCGLTFAKGKVPTPFGDVSVSWRSVKSGFSVNFSVPEGTELLLVTPGSPISERFGPGRHRVTRVIPKMASRVE